MWCVESLENGVWILTLLSGSVSVQCRDLDTHAQFFVFCCKHMVWVLVSGLVLYVFVEHLLNVYVEHQKLQFFKTTFLGPQFLSGKPLGHMTTNIFFSILIVPFEHSVDYK